MGDQFDDARSIMVSTIKPIAPRSFDGTLHTVAIQWLHIPSNRKPCKTDFLDRIRVPYVTKGQTLNFGQTAPACILAVTVWSTGQNRNEEKRRDLQGQRSTHSWSSGGLVLKQAFCFLVHGLHRAFHEPAVNTSLPAELWELEPGTGTNTSSGFLRVAWMALQDTTDP